ncbi:hypothetical protein IU497_36735 [Nocardia terpenica]|nr:hypothetical protein [Nocardia terpenica]
MHSYNHQRRHSAIEMLSPIDYEHSLSVAPKQLTRFRVWCREW